jgi:hypothetical protein
VGYEVDRLYLEGSLLMSLPLIVVEGRDVGMFSTAEALTLKLEPPDVKAVTYTVFDSRGRRVELGVETGEVESVVVTGIEPEPTHEGELRSALISGLTAAFGEATEDLERLRLRELVDLAVQRFGIDD